MTRRARFILVFVTLAALTLLTFALGVSLGSMPIPLKETISILLGRSGGPNAGIILQIRLPQTLTAALLGGALALSGFLLQTFFSNPIAGPFVLGISSGAKMCVALVMVLFASRFLPSWALVGAAFAGALLTVALILPMARRVRSMATVLVAGIMIGYICSAITEFAISFADDADIVNLRNWSLGSFSGMTWEKVGVAAALVAAGLAVSILLSKPMSAYQLGEVHAQSVGVSIRAFRAGLILLSSLLTACVTAFAGPISFVGVAVPHLIRRALGSSWPLAAIPATFLGGAVFCMGCDLIARALFNGQLNISTITAFFGAPVVMLILLDRRKER